MIEVSSQESAFPAATEYTRPNQGMLLNSDRSMVIIFDSCAEYVQQISLFNTECPEIYHKSAYVQQISLFNTDCPEIYHKSVLHLTKYIPVYT